MPTVYLLTMIDYSRHLLANPNRETGYLISEKSLPVVSKYSVLYGNRRETYVDRQNIDI